MNNHSIFYILCDYSMINILNDNTITYIIKKTFYSNKKCE